MFKSKKNKETASRIAALVLAFLMVFQYTASGLSIYSWAEDNNEETVQEEQQEEVTEQEVAEAPAEKEPQQQQSSEQGGSESSQADVEKEQKTAVEIVIFLRPNCSVVNVKV